VVVLVLICVCAIVKLATGGNNDDNGGGSGKSGGGATAGLNTPVRDGKFEFTVSGVQCGKTQVGNEVVNKTAQGQFCLVSMSVKNIGDKPQTFSDNYQKAKGTDGASYAADSEAGLYANENAQTFYTDVNPGNTVNGVVVFDVPPTATIATLELHDSAFSGGTTVKVS